MRTDPPITGPLPDGPSLDPASSARDRRRLLVGIALIVLAAVNLRPALTMVGPLVPDIQRHFDLGGAAAGALTTVPLFFFGAYGLVAPLVARVLGRPPAGEGLIVAGMGLLAVGLALRLVDAPAALYAGSLVAGFAISIGNVAIPGIIKRDFPDSVATVTAVYTIAVTLSASATAALAVPLAVGLGGGDAVDGWRPALGWLLVPAGLALVAWLPRAVQAVRAARRAVGPAPADGEPLWRQPLAWHVTGFMGLQSMMFYIVVAWVPALCQDRGMEPETAGYVLAVGSLVNALGALSVPALVRRMRDQRPLALATVAFSVAGLAGLAWAPVATVWIWTSVLGIGQGVGFALALSLLGLRAADAGTAARLSGMAQGIGYVIAAGGPFAIGAIRDASGGWTVPILVVLSLNLLMAVPGIAAGRNRVLR